MNEINNDNIFGQNQQNMNNSNKNQGPQNNNFYQGMNQPNNNNNNQMMNQNMGNMGNMGNMNIQVLNQDNKSDINGIQNICMSNISNNDPHKLISAALKNKYSGEWIVVISEPNDNFEFNVSDFNMSNIIALQIGPKNIYICRYV